jgi:UDP-2-acetamido-3-amino-2,3-dideoxy-glucuronate N-acetyltransferase
VEKLILERGGGNIDSTVFVHESSYIDSDCTIGSNTKIWHFCHVLGNTRIGSNCSFGQNCVVGPNVEVGSGVKVQNNISIYEGVRIEDNVFLGPSMVFTNVVNPRSFVIRRDEFRQTLVKFGASIGANATVVCGITIGAYALVGAGSTVTRDVPDFALIYGTPAKIQGWVSVAGNKLSFDSQGLATDSEDGSRYKLEGENGVVWLNKGKS